MTITTSIEISEIKDAIAALTPPKSTLEAVLTELFPVIQERLEHGVTKKAILRLLADKGLKVHPAKFKLLLDQTAERQKNSATQAAHTANGGRKQ